MPVHQVEAPDGQIIKVEAPEGASQADILAFAEANYKPKEPEEKQSGLRQVADIPVNFAKGISQGVRMLSDAFGADNAVSANLRGVEDYLGGLLSAQAKNDQQEIAKIFKEAEDKGVLDQVKAGLKAFTVAPIDIMSQAFGTIIPTLAGGLAGQALKIGARTAAVGTGAVMGTGVGKSSIYDAVTEELKQAGLPPEAIQQAATQAQEYGGKNLDLILANTLLGGVAAGTGIERALIPGMVKNISANIAKRGALGRGLATGAPELLTEGAQGGTEQLTQNVALQREGFDVPTFRGVGTAATMEAVAGGTLGAGIGAFSRPQEAPIAPTTEDARAQARTGVEAPIAPPEAPPAAPFVPQVVPQQYSTQQGVDLATGVAGGTGLTPADFLGAGEAAIQPGQRERAQALAAQQFGFDQTGTQRMPAFEQIQGLTPQTAQAFIDQDRFQQQTAAPVVTPSQTIPRTPTQPLNAEQMRQRIDEQSGLLGQMQQEPFAFDRNRLSTQADVAGGTGQVRGAPRAQLVDVNPMPPVVARQRLAVLKDELARNGQDPNSLFIVPHPTMGGRFAIEQRVTEQPYVAPPIETPTVSRAEAQQRIESSALAGSERQRLNEDQGRQNIISRAMRNIEQRGGVASPEEAQILRDANMGTPYNRIDYGLARQGTVDERLTQATGLELARTPRETIPRPATGEAAAESQARAAVEERQRLNEQRRQLGLEQLAEDEQTAAFTARRAQEAEQRAAQAQQQELYQQRQAALQETFGNLPPNPREVIAALSTPSVARNAQQIKTVQLAQARMTPNDFSILEMVADNPNSMPNALQRIENEHKIKYSLSNDATPEVKATVADLRKQLLPILRRFGLEKVGLRLVDSIENGKADGMYAKQVITLALDSDNPMGVMRHEVIHALKELGAFTPAEWKVLSKAAKDTWINQFFNRALQDQYQQVYLEQNGDLDGFQEYLQEEAIAQAFRFYTETKPPSGMIANLMRRLNAFFDALGNFFRGQGFQNIDEMFLPNRIFADIERGAIQPGREQGRVEMTPQEWKAKPADIAQAAAYEMENGIAPYLSEGQLELAVPVARYSIKPSYTPKQLAKSDKENHPILGVPLNKNGTVTLYLPTNNAEARRIIREKRLKGNTPEANRIYLTNESSGPKVMSNPGNIDHTMDGANVLLHVDPAYLQLDQEYPDGRKDFFIQIAEGEAFAKKMAQTKLFTLDAPRDRAISKETTLKEIETKIKDGVESYKQMDAKEKRARYKQAKDSLKAQHNVTTLLTENGKLQKTRVGDYGLKFEGNSVSSMGLGLASAQKITEKLSSCPRSARCESLCLGETSGQNLLYGGDGQFKSGPRLSQYLKTEAMVLSPEDFAIVLYEEINRFKNQALNPKGTEIVEDASGNEVTAPKQVYQPAIRLNVTSDFAPKTFEPIIAAFPDVEFYDYTKLNTQTIAPNHHLTYSSDGVAQEVNGQTVGVGSNWKEMTKKLDSGKNVAMAFTSRKAMPEFLLDEATGKKYQVWNGDNYDARFLDPKPGEKGNKLNQGMIIGLTNKDRTGKPEDAAIKNDGFFVDYDPARDGKTLTIKDQSKFVKEQKIAMPGQKFSLRAPTTPEFKRFFKDSKVVDENGQPLVLYRGQRRDSGGDNFDLRTRATPSFTDNANVANVYSATPTGELSRDSMVIPGYMRMAKPLDLREYGSEPARLLDLLGDAGLWGRVDNSEILKVIQDLSEQQFNTGFLSTNVNDLDLDDVAQELNQAVAAKDEDRITQILDETRIDPYALADSKVFVNALKRQGRFDGIIVKDVLTDSLAEQAGTREYDAYRPFETSQFKSAFNQRPTESSDIRYSLRAPKTPEFKRFFGNSKITNPDGTPKVMYHGTARIIDEFIPKQAGAIFVTENPEFAGKFAEDSINYMVLEQIEELGAAYAKMQPADQVKFLQKAYRLGAKNNDISKNVAKANIGILDRDLESGRFTDLSESYFNEVSEFFRDSIRKKLKSGENIMPLYVRAENPFDFENPDHINQMHERLVSIIGSEFTPPKSRYATGDWPALEDETVQSIIKDLGFDGFYVKEGGEKNLAVYNPNQIKSAIGNRGTFDETGRILYSLKNAPPNRYTKMTDDPALGKTISKVTESTLNAVRSDSSRTSARVQFIDTSAGLTNTLKSMPLFDTNGTLRADMLHHSKAQAQNVIGTGLVSGLPYLNDDGTIAIERSENNLARALQIADRLNTNPNVIASGLSGKELIAEVARSLRGADILAEDAEARKLGERQIAEAQRMTAELAANKDTMTPKQIAKAQKAITKKRIEGNKNRKMNRELQVKPEDIAWARKQLDLIPEVQEVLDIWKAVNTSLVTLYEETGMIDKETADKYRANKNYVPLFKSREDLDDSAFFRSTGAKSTPKIKALEGANITRNIWENIYKQYAMMTAAAYENQTRRVSVEQMRGISPDLAIITTPDDKRVNLRYRDKGKDVDVIIENPNDLAAFQSMTYQISPVMKFLGGFTNVLRAGALLNPMFWIRQLIRDPIQATITGQSGIVTPFHSIKEFLMISGSPEARLLAQRGVIGKIDNTQSLNEYLENVGKPTQIAPNMIQKTFRKLLQIHEASDAATRVAIFKQAKAKAIKDGMSEPQAVDYAVMKAREYINFAVTGNSPTLANLRQMIPFMNATIVGLDALYRAYTGIGLSPEERAKVRRTFRIRATMMVAMSVAYAMSLQDDEDYKKLPDYVKDGNMLFPIGSNENKTFLKFSIPYEVGFLFKTLPELFVRYLAGNSTGKEVLASMRAGFIQNMPTGGTPVPQFAKPALEVMTNHSFFTNRPIEGMGDSRLPVAQRGQRASEFAKMMSGLGLDKVGLSPAKIDVLTKGYFAEFGTFFNELTDAFVATTSGTVKTPRNVQNLPFFKAFLTDPQVNKAISDFYDIEKNATQVANLFSSYKSTGQGEMMREMIADPEKRMAIGSAPVLRQISGAMSDIQKAIRTIDKDQSIAPAERRERINQLQQQLGMLAERGRQMADTMGLSR